MVRPRDWTPCIADPIRFDCRDCSIGPDVECKYRTDETLRHERAARLGELVGLVPDGEERAIEAVSAVRAVLMQQQMALPAAALVKLLPARLASVLGAEQVEVVLRRIPGIRETSPGMFRWQGGDATQSVPQTLSEDVSTGAAFARMLEEHPPLPPEVRRAKFKRLDGLRQLRVFERVETAGEVITATVDRLATRVLQREGWSIADAAAFAIDGSLVPPKWESGSDDQAERREFLAGICALNITGDSGSSSSAHSELRKELLCSNVRLLAHAARNYSSGDFLQYADIFQAGFEGLDRAVDLYDPYRGYEFSTYATNWIRQAITRTIANEERTIRIPVHAIDALGRMEASEEELSWRLGRAPAAAEVAGDTGFTIEQVENLTRGGQRVVRISDDMLEELEDPQDALDEVESTVAGASVREVLQSVLTERERSVVERRFGFGGNEPQTLEEVGQEFGVTRERIRQIQAKALRKIEARGRERLLALHHPDAQIG